MAAGEFGQAQICFREASRAAVCPGSTALALQRSSACSLALAQVATYQAENQKLERDALSLAEEALSLRPGCALSHLCKASAMYRLGKVDLASTCLQQLLARDQDMGIPLELESRALLLRCWTLGANIGDFGEIAQEVAALQQLLERSCDMEIYHGNSGLFGLEIELLACILEVQALTASHTSCSNRKSVSDHLHDISMVALVRRLTRLVEQSSKEDMYELLWQALAWRCRAHFLAQSWPDVELDATSALELNIFASADVRPPGNAALGYFSGAAQPAAAGQETSDRDLVSSVLSNEWYCLQMRAVARERSHQFDAACADRELLRRLAPPREVETQLVPKASVETKPEPWRRSPEQKATLQRKRQFRVSRVLGMPHGM